MVCFVWGVFWVYVLRNKYIYGDLVGIFVMYYMIWVKWWFKIIGEWNIMFDIWNVVVDVYFFRCVE